MDASPTISILLLGDSDCGKSVFLSKLSHGANSMREKTTAFPPLRDLDQPFIYDIRMYNRPYRFEFYDTSCPENYTLLRPDFVVLCYSIGNRESLVNLQHVWFKKMVDCYMREREDIPVMMLGLKRDLRKEEEGMILPQEGLKFAQDLRCDRYAECSALTGELMNEVMEDIARTAAKTTTEAGGLSQGGCIVM